MDDADRFPLAVVYAALILLGGVLGIWGAFLVPLRLPGGIEGLADVIAVGGNLVVGVLAARSTRTVQAAAMPGLGWLVAVLLVLTVVRPADEVIIPGRIPSDPGIGPVGTLFLLGGAVGAVVAVLLAGRFTRGAGPPTPQG
ncbi:MAG: hypothetical protein QOJ03_2202 [Frankiaceae bacterium]|nr:hypothetical protein [Frankiaceae bacterium]